MAAKGLPPCDTPQPTPSAPRSIRRWPSPCPTSASGSLGFPECRGRQAGGRHSQTFACNDRASPNSRHCSGFRWQHLDGLFGVVDAHPTTLRALLHGGGELRHGLVRIVGNVDNTKVQPDGFGIGRVQLDALHLVEQPS